MKDMSQRQHRVAEEVRHITASTLLRHEIPTIAPLTSAVMMRLNITYVWISPDLSLARLFVTFPQTNLQEENTTPADALIAAANRQLSGPLRKALANQLAGRRAPKIEFLPSEE